MEEQYRPNLIDGCDWFDHIPSSRGLSDAVIDYTIDRWKAPNLNLLVDPIFDLRYLSQINHIRENYRSNKTATDKWASMMLMKAGDNSDSI